MIKKISVLFIVAIISLIQISILAIWTRNDELNKIENMADNFAQKIEGLKGQVYLFSQLAKATLEQNNTSTNLTSTSEIYSINYDKFLTSNGVALNNKLHRIFSQKHSWLDSSDLLYFKLFDSKTIISDRPIKRFINNSWEIENVFSKDYCERTYVCTSDASKENLSDDFIFSQAHVDYDTHRVTLTIITPITIDRMIVAETHLDVRLDRWDSFKNSYVASSRKGENVNITVSNKNYSSSYSWKKVISVDSHTSITFERHYGNLITLGASFFLFLTICNSLIIFYFVEKRKHIKTKRESMLDPLTGCFNRKILKSNVLKKKFSNNEKSCVIVFDGNKIKHINDTYGHSIGDIAIIEISLAIKSAFRKQDYVIRIGGDEFVVLAIGMTIEKAKKAIETINQNLAKSSVINDEFISVSAGVSECLKFSHLEESIRSADKNLYIEKRK